MISIVLDLLVIVLAPFLFAGVILRVKSFWAGRQGPGLLQPWFDFRRLLLKGQVYSRTTTAVFRIAPTLNLAAVLTASCFVPLAGREPLFGFDGDFIVFAYILALGKFFVILASLDTGSSFEGMGASREALFPGLAEPGFFVILASSASLNGVSSFRDLIQLVYLDSWSTSTIVVVSAFAFFVMLLIEGCRVPVDDPATHLELTMIHEVMILDNSGPDLGVSMFASWLKMTIFGAVIAGVILPGDLNHALFALLFTLILLVLAVAVGTIESLMARLRMIHVPQMALLVNALGLVVLTVIQLSIFGGTR